MAVVLGTALLLAGVATPPSDQWLCSHFAAGARGSSVDVAIYVDMGGEVARSITWVPPHNLKRGERKKPQLYNQINLIVEYDEAGESGIGRPSGIYVSTITRTRSPARWIENGSAILTLTDGNRYQANITRKLKTHDTVFYSGDFNGFDNETVDRKAIGGSLQAADQAHLTVEDRRGKPRLTTSYFLANHGERDRLFNEAWSAVREALKSPAKCEKLQDDPSLESYIPVP